MRFWKRKNNSFRDKSKPYQNHTMDEWNMTFRCRYAICVLEQDSTRVPRYWGYGFRWGLTWGFFLHSFCCLGRYLLYYYQIPVTQALMGFLYTMSVHLCMFNISPFALVPLIVVLKYCLMYCVWSGRTYHFCDLQDLLIFLYMCFYCYSSSLLLYLNQLWPSLV